jgi:pSer/pThr/pTyr-binding forkhead associated (FHA) protein
MHDVDRNNGTMDKHELRINELTAALHNAEQKLAQRDALLTTAIGQTEAARSKYEQANERAESLRRRLEAKDEQVSNLQKELQHRNERIATLEQLCAENDNALHAINQDVKRQNLASPSEQLAALGLVLESLDEPGVRHRIGRTTTTIGRSRSNDIAIRSPSISRYHARIVIEADGAYLIDLQSTNGCSVNGERVFRQLINDRDIIRIGEAKYRLAIDLSASDTEDRSMDATHALLEDDEIFSVVPKTEVKSAKEHAGKAKAIAN